MIEAHAVELNKYVLYDHARFEFAPGITRIGGDNRSGKSLLLSGLHNLLYGAPPVMAAKRSAKQMLSRSGGYYQFEGKANGKPFIFRQSSKGKSVEYSISVNGKDEGRLTQASAAELMREIIPGNDRMFASTVYITSSQSNPLQFGSGAEKIKFLELLFDIEAFESLREKIAEKFGKAQAAMRELAILRQEYDSIGKPDPLAKHAARIMSQVVERNQAELKEKQEFERNNIELKALEDQLVFPNTNDAQLAANLKELETLEEAMRKKIMKLREAKLKRDAGKSKMEEYNHQLRLVKRYRSDIADFKTAYNKTNPDKVMNNTKLANVLIRRTRHEAKSHSMRDRHDAMLEVYNRSRKLYSKIEKLAFKEHTASFGQTKMTTKVMLAVYDRLNSVVDVSLSDHTKSCPLCQQALPKDRVKDINYDLKVLRTARKVAAAVGIENMRWFADAKPAASDVLRRMERKCDIEEKRFELCNRIISAVENLTEAQTALKGLPRVSVEDDDVDYDKMISSRTASLNDVRRQCEKISNEMTVRASIMAKKTLKPVVTNATDRVVELGSYMTGIIREKISRQRKDETRRQEIAEQVKKLSKLADHEDVLSALHDAYGPRGLKVQHMADIASLLESAFNTFATSIFPEPIFFNFSVAPTKLDVSVERNSIVSDVALLSGSETRMFQILCMASLMEYLPAEYRWDTVIFDEIEANMKDDTRKFLMQTCIPQLAKSISKINIISPLSREELFIEHGHDYTVREYEVVKSRGKSTLVRAE